MLFVLPSGSTISCIYSGAINVWPARLESLRVACFFQDPAFRLQSPDSQKFMSGCSRLFERIPLLLGGCRVILALCHGQAPEAWMTLSRGVHDPQLDRGQITCVWNSETALEINLPYAIPYADGLLVRVLESPGVIDMVI
jgi:hypothetical protein